MRRGNSVRPGTGVRRSNVAGFPAYPETLRPGQGLDGQPIEGESSAVPPPVILNGSALPKAAAVVVEIPSANDDVAPDSSTRSKDEVAVAKEVDAPPKVEEPEAEKEEPKAKEPTVKMRTDRPERPERRSRDRGKGKGRSAAPPPVAPNVIEDEPKVSAPPPAEKTVEAATASVVVAPKETAEKAAAPADLDEKFFAEGVDSEQEMLAAKSATPSMPIEDEIDPKILLKLHPDVRARRAKFWPIVQWVGIGCAVLIGAAGLVRYKNNQSSQEAADRDMAAYAAAHTYTEPTDKPPPPLAPTQAAPAAANTAAAAPGDPEAIPPPADTAAGNAPGKPPLGPEAKAVAAAALGAPAPPGAAAGTAQTDTETPPAKTAQQEKRDAQVFLDRGAFGSAIAAGERSVNLDPTDGEAWLLLGAAYQSQGRAGDAKRSFNNCLKQGKKGPIGECRAMLQ
jgi:hypothetical protein